MSNSANNNLTFSVPSHGKLKSAASCRACDTHITFKKLPSGKSIALEDDGNRHRCNQWWTWRADND